MFNARHGICCTCCRPNTGLVQLARGVVTPT